jgi:O-antigen ligase
LTRLRGKPKLAAAVGSRLIRVTAGAFSFSFAQRMNREVLDHWCERGILFLVLAILIFGPLAMGAVETQFFLVIQGLTLGVILLWSLRLWLAPGAQLLWPPVCWAVLAFALYAIARYLTADIEYVARLEMVRVLIYAFLFFAILNNLHRQEPMHAIVLTLIFLAMGISFYAVYQFLTSADSVSAYFQPFSHRSSGTYVSPNHLAGFLEMILPLSLAWMVASRAKPVLKVFIGYASLAILAGITTTASRGGWVSAGLVLIIFFSVLIFNRAFRLPSLVLLAVLIGAGLFFIPRTHYFKDRFKELAKNEKLNDDTRFDLWRPAVQLWQENIWWGIGPGHYNFRFRAYRPETEQLQPDRVHNDYLNTLTDWGMAGTALVVSAWALLAAGVLKTWRVVRNAPGEFGGRKSNKFALVLGAALGLLAILFHSVVDFNMHIPANAILVVTLMALLSGCLRFSTEKYWLRACAGVKVLVTVVLLAGMGYLGWQGARRARENHWLEQAQQSPLFSPVQAAALEKAFAIEPQNAETAYAIGEAFRVQSWEGGDDYAELAAKAMDWFKRGMKLNPYDGYNYMRHGMCLDWLDRHEEAEPFFAEAVRLDPNGYFTAANVGWHYVQLADYAAAREWLQRSRRLQGDDNPIAYRYLKIANQKLLEAATNSNPTGVELPAR